MPIQAVLFDMDGVLIDSEPVYLDIIMQMYKEIGAPVSAAEHFESLGCKSEEWWRHILEKYAIDGCTPQALAAEEAARTLAYFYDDSQKKQYFPHLKQTLRALKEAGYRLAVASASPYPVIEKVLALGGIDTYFDAAVSSSDPDVKNGKPAPDVFLCAARRLGCAPESCIVVEDSSRGIAAAKAAGMRCLAFLSAPMPVDVSQADATFETYRDFLKVADKFI